MLNKELTIVKDLYKNTDSYINTAVTVGGWVRTMRCSKSFGFIELNDGSFFKSLQIVFEDSLDNFAQISKIGVGTSLIV